MGDLRFAVNPRHYWWLAFMMKIKNSAKNDLTNLHFLFTNISSNHTIEENSFVKIVKGFLLHLSKAQGTK